MENVEKRVNVRLIAEWESATSTDFSGRKRDCARSLIAKSNFHSVKYFNDNFCAFQMRKLNVYYDKPIYLGFAVLDISKWKMYDFHYQTMKPKFGECVHLNFKTS